MRVTMAGNVCYYTGYAKIIKALEHAVAQVGTVEQNEDIRTCKTETGFGG